MPSCGRRELLDHVILSATGTWIRWFASTRYTSMRLDPIRGIGQRVPSGVRHHDLSKPIVIRPVLGGLHADYRRAA